jgi:hypothetical protein
MSKKLAYTITDNNISVNFDNQSHIVPRTDPLANKLLAALREGRNDDIPDLVSTALRIQKYGKGDFVIQDGHIIINGLPVHEGLSRKILQFQAEGLPHKPLVRFAENLQKNPSYRAVNELFQFLEKNDHPITEDGNFIAYKRVRSDFTDIHSGTFDNSVGATVEMPRNQVNEDSMQTCSHGLHVANWNYAHTQFASSNPATDVMLEVEVSPSDVVSIPVDYNQSKMRVCKYKVLGVVDSEHSSDLRLRNTNTPTYKVEENSDSDRYNECENCGIDVDYGTYLCESCQYDEEEEEEEEEDEYPWKDELDR